MKPWKVQKFFSDIVYDLRQRNLLLVVILLIVGIVAVPILITRGSGSESPPAANLSAQTASSTNETQPAVLAYGPAGIRNYKRRLDELAAKDPFRQQFAPSAAASAVGTSGEDVSGAPTTDGGGSTDGGGTIDEGTKTITKTKTKTKTKYVYFQTDVAAGESGGALTPMTNIPQFTFLPSAQAPVLVFLGTSSGGSQAIFMVAKDVVSVGGEGLCYPSPDSCQLLALAAGKAADMIYGPDHKTYRVQVTKIKRVSSSKPPA